MKQTKKDALEFLDELESKKADKMIDTELQVRSDLVGSLQAACKCLQWCETVYKAARSAHVQPARSQAIVHRTVNTYDSQTNPLAAKLIDSLEDRHVLDLKDSPKEFSVRLDAAIDVLWVLITTIGEGDL